MTIRTWAVIGAVLLAGFTWAEVRVPTPVQAWERTDVLPARVQGRFPVTMPKYEGVDALLVLSSRWVIVVTNNIDAVYAQIDALTQGKFAGAIAAWDASANSGRPNWDAYRTRGVLYADNVAAARKAAGEQLLDAPDFYRVHEDGGAPRAPRRVNRIIVGLGENLGPAMGKLKGASSIYYAHYSYLELPTPMTQGHTYTIALRDGRSVTFVYDETRTVSRPIKVNQVGYLPDAKEKFAYLGAAGFALGPIDFSDAKTFSVVDVHSGEVVFRGEVRLRAKNPRFTVSPSKPDDDPATRPLITGEDTYELDLGGLTAIGDFFITIPGVGRSWTFRHAPDVYGAAFYTAARVLYHQRCGIALQQPYTAWTRPICHIDPIYESEHIGWGCGADFRVPRQYQVFDVVGGSMDKTRKTDHPRGGWHDAADWDRNLSHYNDLFALQYAFELMPKKFSDGQLNIPESANGVPDILDEAEFGLEVWKRSMTPDGGVASMVETFTHPPRDDPRYPYAYGRRTRWSSLLFAAAAAQFAKLVRPFDAKKAADYAALAKQAYAFGSDPQHSLGETEIHAKRNRGSGDAYTISWTETDAMIVPYLIHADLRMYLLTGDAHYLDGVPALVKKAKGPYSPSNVHSTYTAWQYFDIARLPNGVLPAETQAFCRDAYVKTAESRAACHAKMPYRCSWPAEQDFWMGWGATTMTNYSRAELLAWHLTGTPALREAAVQNADYALGANPMGMCWTTGLGYTYPIDIQHENSETDSILDPVPGITVYGTIGGMYYNLRTQAWQAPKAHGSAETVSFIAQENQQIPLFRTFSVHPHLATAQNEFTISETGAALIFTTALLLPDGWMPDAELKTQGPRPDAGLFGYYYLP
jgi:endoglucanase